MFKLVAVGGKIRGQEIILSEGENILGRAPDCTQQLPIDGISKKHMRVTVNGETAYVEDLGSANGTFVNGKIIKKMTVKSGDKVALPNVIFQVVYVSEKKIVVKKKVVKIKEDAQAENTSDLESEPVPVDAIGKIKHMFKHKIMKPIYGFNEEYEWHSLFGIILALFIVVTITLTIFPVLRDSRNILLYELGKRGIHYTEDIARLNARALERKDIDKLDTKFLDNEDGVTSYELFDMEGRIVSPISKLNQYISDPFSVEARNEISKKKPFTPKFLDDGEVGLAKPIVAYNVRSGLEEPVGIIAIRFSPRSLTMESANNLRAYLESLSTSLVVALFFFGVMYYLTTRPIEELRVQIEYALRGKVKEIELKGMMKELAPLKNSISSLVHRVRELQHDSGAGAANLEDDGSYLNSLKEFLMGAQGAVLILNSEKIIHALNLQCEDLLGIRANASTGAALIDTARDQGFAATVIDLCDKSASNAGTNQKDTYELAGASYEVNVVAMMGKDSFAKGFYITFVKE